MGQGSRLGAQELGLLAKLNERRALSIHIEYRRVLVVLLYQCAFVGLGIAVAMLVALTGMNMVLPDQVDQLARNPTAQTASAFLSRLQSAPGGEPCGPVL